MKLIGQAIEMLKLFHHHSQLHRAGIKHTVQHALQTTNGGRQGRAQLVRHRDVRGAELFFIAGELPRHGVKVVCKADHFRWRILDQFRLTAKLPVGDIFGGIAKTAELQRQRSGVF